MSAMDEEGRQRGKQGTELVDTCCRTLYGMAGPRTAVDAFEALGAPAAATILRRSSVAMLWRCALSNSIQS
eukprot:6180838-Pleurochrysis_carterae.AAC.3